MGLQVFRCGLNLVDANDHRAVFSHTWMTTDAIYPNEAGQMYQMCTQLAYPFGTGDVPKYEHWPVFITQLWPLSGRASGMAYYPNSVLPPLNVNAPEAAFRLQRVGANGSIGRCTMPILTDDWFTDLPARRHVDTATLAPLLAANLDALPKSLYLARATFYNVIWNRQTLVCDNVVSHRLLENPVRLWQRWHTYPKARGSSGDYIWGPDEGGERTEKVHH